MINRRAGAGRLRQCRGTHKHFSDQWSRRVSASAVHGRIRRSSGQTLQQRYTHRGTRARRQLGSADCDARRCGPSRAHRKRRTRMFGWRAKVISRALAAAYRMMAASVAESDTALPDGGRAESVDCRTTDAVAPHDNASDDCAPAIFVGLRNRVRTRAASWVKTRRVTRDRAASSVPIDAASDHA
jgi:hypothetical protein